MQEATSDAPVSQQAAASVSQELADELQEPSGIPRESGGIPREDSPIQGLVRGYPGGSGEQSDSLQSLRDRQAGLEGEQVCCLGPAVLGRRASCCWSVLWLICIWLDWQGLGEQATEQGSQ